MPKLQRNVRVIASAVAGPKMVYQIDGTPGLNLAALGNGKASWRLRYRPRRGAEKRWHTIGDAQTVTLGEAMDKARELMSALQLEGVDPKGAIEQPAKLTFDQLFTDWMERHAKVKKKSWSHDAGLYKRHVAPRLGNRPVTDISRREVIAALSDIATSVSGVQSNRCLSLVSAVFTWAVSMEIIEVHPTMKIPKFGTENVRDRTWTHGEMRSLWHALNRIIDGTDDGPITPSTARPIKLLMLTGQRRTEVAHALVAEFTDGAWIVPAIRMKAGRQHTVPLAPLAANVVASAIAANGGSRLVFPGCFDAELEPDSISRALERLTASLGIVGATVHDLRRTMASEMGRLGIAESTISRVLAHAQSGITARHYNLHSYDAEKRAALERWEAELVRVVSSTGNPTAPAALS